MHRYHPVIYMVLRSVVIRLIQQPIEGKRCKIDASNLLQEAVLSAPGIISASKPNIPTKSWRRTAVATLPLSRGALAGLTTIHGPTIKHGYVLLLRTP